MSKDTTVLAFRQREAIDDPLSELAREGARRRLAQVLIAEADSFVAMWKDLKLPDGRDRVVRQGHGPHRAIQTGVGPVEVRRAKVRDRGDVGAEEKIRFTSSILPKWARRTKSLDALLSVLYLRGVSTGDFQEALAALLGKDAPNMSPAVISRLTAEWQADYDAWQKRDLSARRYVYVWADGVYPRKDLLDRLPEAERAVADREVRRNLEPTLLDVDEKLAPALCVLTYPGLEADEFLLALGCCADQHQHTFGGFFHSGLQVGCDYRLSVPLGFWNPNIVVGAFGDFLGGSLRGTQTTSVMVGTETERSAWAVGGRAGWLVTPRFLTYFDGGYTQAHFGQVNYNFNFVGGGSAGLSLGAQNYNGWFIGGGFEYAVDLLPIKGLFLKTEYRYSQYKHRLARFHLYGIWSDEWRLAQHDQIHPDDLD